MAYDPNLWAPADIPGYLQMPIPKDPVDPTGTPEDTPPGSSIDELQQVLNRSQAQNSRVVKLLNRFRVVMADEAPDASGSGFLWIDTNDGKVYYDDPLADPIAWAGVTMGRTLVSPSAVTLNTGGLTAGDVDSFATILDGDVYTVAEVTGVPGFDIELDFSDLAAITDIIIRMKYVGSATHIVNLLIYNYDTTSYDVFSHLVGGLDAYQVYSIPIPDDTNYIDSGAAKIKIYHSTTGNASHDVYVDYVAVSV